MNHTHIVQYFCDDLGIHLHSTLLLSESNGSIMFPLLVALTRAEGDYETFRYLWESQSHLWAVDSVLEALTILYSSKNSNIDVRDDLMAFIMRSKTAHSLFMALSHQ